MSVSSNLQLAFKQVSQLRRQILTSLHLPLHLHPYPVVTVPHPLLGDEARVEWLQFPKHTLVQLFHLDNRICATQIVIGWQ